MPLKIKNNHDHISLSDLVCLRAAGYSVLKSPHIGNQHPSNLVCAALQIPLEMVSFTQGFRDRNFHPHLRIQAGQQELLYQAQIWTQFAKLPDGLSATEYHQTAIKQVFPQTEICTDMERMQQYPALAAVVLRATNKVIRGLWYRSVNSSGQVSKKTQSFLSDSALETDVFQFTNPNSGWVTPNRVQIIFDLVYQSLASGRDTVYHLSGPQMTQYIGDQKLQSDLQLMYDAVRQYIPVLPLTLEVCIVPVAGARFAGLQSDASGIHNVCEVITSVGLSNLNPAWCKELAAEVPMVATSIETGTTLSQYDLQQAADLYVNPWMLNTPLQTVNLAQHLLAQAGCAIAAE